MLFQYNLHLIVLSLQVIFFWRIRKSVLKGGLKLGMRTLFPLPLRAHNFKVYGKTLGTPPILVTQLSYVKELK